MAEEFLMIYIYIYVYRAYNDNADGLNNTVYNCNRKLYYPKFAKMSDFSGET